MTEEEAEVIARAQEYMKASYLNNLLELLPTTAKIQTINSLKGKSLVEQVKLLNKYVYIIEVN